MVRARLYVLATPSRSAELVHHGEAMFYSPLFRKFRRDNPTLTLRQALALYAEIAHWCDEIERAQISHELPPRDVSGRFMARESDLPHALDPDALDHLSLDSKRIPRATRLDAESLGNWLSPPVFETVTYITDPRSYAGTWEDGVRTTGDHRFDEVIFEELDREPAEPDVVWNPDSDFDDIAYERERRRIVAGRKRRFKNLVPGDEAVNEVALRDRTGKIGRILRACEENPKALLLIKDDLATWAETTIASDGEPVGLGMRREDRSPLLAILLVALSTDALNKMDALSDAERGDKERVSACWEDFNAFTRDIHRILVRARIIIPPPPDRSRQFAELEAWAKEPNPEDSRERREAFLRPWRVRAIRIACYLHDARRSDEHTYPNHVGWLSHRAESPFQAAGVDQDAIRRLLEGHPNKDVQDLLTEFNDGFTIANSAPVRAHPTAGMSELDLIREARGRRRW